jgi:hypothetical protein
MIDITGKKFTRLTPIFQYKRTYPSGRTQLGWICRCDCGNVKWQLTYDLTSLKVKSCGCYNSEVARKKLSGENNPSWKGGLPIKTKRGYMEYKSGVNRGKLVHRIVWESHYGVSLKTNQNIHHINGDRTDNRIENLQLWDTSQPKGQRVEDKLEYYFSLIKEYKDNPIYKKLINFHLSDLEM